MSSFLCVQYDSNDTVDYEYNVVFTAEKDSNVGAAKFSVENIVSDGDNEKTIIVNHVMNIVNDENNNNNNGSD